MIKSKSFFVLLTVVVAAFSLVIYSSCSKSHHDPCSNVLCYNTGYCSNGYCVCPTGYSGSQCQYSSITYVNNTFTNASITLGGNTQTVNPGSSVTYTGLSGDGANFSASTYGSFGDIYTWQSATDYFPSGGNTSTIGLDVNADYYYLIVRNNSPYYITSMTVNSGLSDQASFNCSVPNDGNNYGIGYFLAYNYPTNAVSAQNASAGVLWSNQYLNIPNTDNASVTVVFH